MLLHLAAASALIRVGTDLDTLGTAGTTPFYMDASAKGASITSFDG